MAAPNLANPSTIIGKTAVLSLASTTETTLVTNAASSNKVFRIAHVTIANTGTATITATVRHYSAATGGTATSHGTTMPISPGSSLIVVGKENPVWLEEDRRITVQASGTTGLDVVCSYEDIS